MNTKRKIGMHTVQNRERNSGMALLIAVIFVSVVLTIGLALSSMGYKQVLLSSSAVQSQNAFYAADSALECALYADQQQYAFLDQSPLYTPATSISCAGTNPSVTEQKATLTGSHWNQFTIGKIVLGANSCAQVVVYKPVITGQKTYIFATGYNNGTCTVSQQTTVRGAYVSYGG